MTPLPRERDAEPTQAPVTEWLPLPRPVEPDPTWARRGACGNAADPDRWIDLPPLTHRGQINPAYREHLATLRATCATCPVFQECLADALTYDVVGVWAGTDEYDRAELREMLGLPSPVALDYDDTESQTAQDQEVIRYNRQRFAARRMAHRGWSNGGIATALGVSRMSVSRMLRDTNEERGQRPRALTATESVDQP